MSKFGHFSDQYFGNKIDFPAESFKIAGISYHQDNLKDIDYNSQLTMELEPDNIYDSSAIKILYNKKIIGYVPKDPAKYKEICNKNLDSNLKIINMKRIKNNFGIRVIPENLYKGDKLF